MDLQTMLKKVKQKQYKSKLEFADDLQLIWDNCFKYNNSDVCSDVILTRSVLFNSLSRTIPYDSVQHVFERRLTVFSAPSPTAETVSNHPSPFLLHPVQRHQSRMESLMVEVTLNNDRPTPYQSRS